MFGFLEIGNEFVCEFTEEEVMSFKGRFFPNGKGMAKLNSEKGNFLSKKREELGLEFLRTNNSETREHLQKMSNEELSKTYLAEKRYKEIFEELFPGLSQFISFPVMEEKRRRRPGRGRSVKR